VGALKNLLHDPSPEARAVVEELMHAGKSHCEQSHLDETASAADDEVDAAAHESADVTEADERVDLTEDTAEEYPQ
jgi:hypothetical protein